MGMTFNPRSRAAARPAWISGAKPLAPVTFRHFRMGETDRAWQQVVGGEGELAVAKVDLKPVFLDIVADGGWRDSHFTSNSF